MRDPAPDEPLREARATCPYCGTGCGVIVQARGTQIVGVRGDPEHPANFGKLCTKGRTLHMTATRDVLDAQRLLQPQRRVGKGGPLEPVAWDAALDEAADRFAAAIGRHPDRVAFYVSGQLLTEDYYVFNKLARTLAGTNNVDSNSRLCMSSAVVGYKRTLGADAPPCSYADLEEAACYFVAGANMAAAHPVLFGRLLEARRRSGATLIVVDPRLTKTARAADLHLQLAPGTDLYLLTAMLGVMLRDGLVDVPFVAQHTVGFEAVAALARSLPLAEAARVTALPELAIERAARLFARAPATLSLYCQGLNQSAHGSDNNAALVHLHLATGQIGRAGAGPFSLTGQPNAMGGRETGTMATLLPGHRDPASAEDRAELAALWGVDALPAAPGLTATALIDACGRGEIDALWIACTNPAQSLPEQARVRAALRQVPFVVVQEAFAATETAAFADLLLPAATFGERTGTMTNSERRIHLSQAVVPPPGQARPDWSIAAEFARRLAARIAPGRAAAFSWAGSADVFAEYARLTAGRDLDVAGLSHARLAQDGPVCWPLRPPAQGAAPSRLYENRRFATADGCARFVPYTLAAAAEPCSDAYPLALTTVRLRDAWHGASRSGVVAALELPPVALQVAPATLQSLGLADEELARLHTVRGAVVLPVAASDSVPPGVVALPMHYGPRWLPSSDGINLLTIAAIDPLSRQPELKHAAARLAPVGDEFAWHGALAVRVTARDVGPALDALRAVAREAGFGAVSLAGRDGTAPVALLQLAHASSLAAPLHALAARLGVSGDAPRLADPRAGRVRVLQLASGRIDAAVLEGRSRADIAAWRVYQALIVDGRDCSHLSMRELFSPMV
jgi:assimilatory nitrate reductase catalytic subunit